MEMQLPMLCGGSSARTEVPHSVPSTNGSGVLRVGAFKLLAGFPGDGCELTPLT